MNLVFLMGVGLINSVKGLGNTAKSLPEFEPDKDPVTPGKREYRAKAM